MKYRIAITAMHESSTQDGLRFNGVEKLAERYVLALPLDERLFVGVGEAERNRDRKYLAIIGGSVA